MKDGFVVPPRNDDVNRSIMKKILFGFLLSGFCVNTIAQIKLPAYADTIFSTYYRQRVSHFETLPQTKGDIIFLGNSITDGGEWSELFADLRVKNRGISGDVTAGVLHRLDEITRRKPAKIFLLIGVNDLARNISPDSILKNIMLTVGYIQQESPATELFIQSILPVNNRFKTFASQTGKIREIALLNAALKSNAAKKHYQFIDINTAFSDTNGRLKEAYTNDGLHLKGDGYLLWKHLIYPSVVGMQQKASLLPLPQKITYSKTVFPLYRCKTILLANAALKPEAVLLQKLLGEKGIRVEIVEEVKRVEVVEEVGKVGPFIELKIGKVDAGQNGNEAYQLQVHQDKIELMAETNAGIFYAVKTLQQLMRDGVMVEGCSITDWPAFPWRGYMVDVGRNFQSVEKLKEQIDVMAAYKLNIFHFHFTEDIAWRLAIKDFPQLTSPENMLRNKGMFYTKNDFKELIHYCAERHITLVPEIDMPGHSAAFKRAMKTDMQSDSGIVYLKSILKGFFANYNLPYFHIGADEVKISNKNFIPEMTAYIESFGKKTIGWEPGGNFGNKTIRQLWMDDAAKQAKGKTVQFIDSRHLYINHMDPLESVVTIFSRKIGNVEKGNVSVLGGTLCLWPDRAVATEDDIFKQNPVYPAMLAFAERSWRGGGRPGWTATIGSPGTDSVRIFEAFENRLLDQKIQSFAKLDFPYVKQAGRVWKLFGPYKNEGDVSRKFAPETGTFYPDKNSAAKEVVGGTIVLRHWWAPLIKAAVDHPEENTTWYATTKVWSDKNAVKEFWIGMNDLSRSPATDSPKPGTWNNMGAAVWVNGKCIEPPQWKHAGYKGNAEMPLADEGYAYRVPTKITLKKGWNTVLIKTPVRNFKGKDWQNPVKWMFTFIPANNN